MVHTATGYLTGIVDWYYDERTASVLWSTVLSFPAVAGAMFGLGPLFLLAGWFSPRSVPTGGSAGFARSRLLRLGVPLAAFMLLIQPRANYVGSLGPDQVRTSFASALRTTEFSVIWFVAALLVFSLAYAGTAVASPRTAVPARGRAGVPAGRRRPDDRRGLAGGLAGVALELRRVLHRQVRRVAPRRRAVRPRGARSRNRGLRDLPPVLARRVGWTALAGTIAAVTLFAVLETKDQVTAVLNTATGWPTILFALLDGMVVVSLSLWFIRWVRRRWPSYLIHPLVLTTIMVLLAPVALAPEIKFVLVAIAAVAACYLAGYALTRVPGISKVL